MTWHKLLTLDKTDGTVDTDYETELLRQFRSGENVDTELVTADKRSIWAHACILAQSEKLKDLQVHHKKDIMLWPGPIQCINSKWSS